MKLQNTVYISDIFWFRTCEKTKLAVSTLLCMDSEENRVQKNKQTKYNNFTKRRGTFADYAKLRNERNGEKGFGAADNSLKHLCNMYVMMWSPVIMIAVTE